MREAISIVLALASLVGGVFLNGCTPRQGLEEPPITIVDASDASALLDVGASPDLCTLECASFAKAGCVRAARSNCVEVCRMALHDGMVSEWHVQRIADADGDLATIQGLVGRACR